MGMNGNSRFDTPTAPAPGPPPPCGVHVNDVEAHIPRPHLAENGVEVGAVVVQQAAGLVNDVGDLLDAPLEHAEGAGVGQHDAGGLRPHRGLERLDVDIAFVIGRDFARHVAEHGRGRRIGAVGSVRHQNLGARRIAARLVVGADHRHPGEFALRPGHRGQAYARHPGHVFEDLLQIVEAGE
jgi:hypothetical protein